MADRFAGLDGKCFLHSRRTDAAGENDLARRHEDRILAIDAVLEIALGDFGFRLAFHIAIRAAFRHDRQFRRIEIHLRSCNASILHLEGNFAAHIAQRRDADIFARWQLCLEGGVIGAAGIFVGACSGPVGLVEIPTHPVAVAKRGAAIEQHSIRHHVKLRRRRLRPQWRRQRRNDKRSAYDIYGKRSHFHHRPHCGSPLAIAVFLPRRTARQANPLCTTFLRRFGFPPIAANPHGGRHSHLFCVFRDLFRL